MSRTFYFGNVTKRKNSTLQGSLSNTYNVLFKNPCSLDSPTITLKHTGDFDYNAAKYTSGSKTYYYFVVDKKALHNDLWEVSLDLDVLATYKSEIQSSTQFVAYSSSVGSTWLVDSRIAVLKNETTVARSTTMNFLFTAGGFYSMAAIGKEGCNIWILDSTMLANVMDRVTGWSDDLIDDIQNGNYPWSDPPQTAVTYDFSTIPDALESFGKMATLTGLAGSGYTNAMNCIRSCIWVPFFIGDFAEGSGEEIYLGQFPTGVSTYKCKTSPKYNTVTVNIPWQFSDWRRGVCESIYLYLPLVGMVNISSDEIINETAITIEWSATATDGSIAYCVKAGSQIIGTYGANAAVNYPIGVSQQSTTGDRVNTLMSHAVKALAIAAIPQASAGLLAAEGVAGAYDIVNTAFTQHTSSVGGIGGGAGVGLDLGATCFSVAHPTNVSPADMAATMGRPTQKPLSLNSLTGFCQCVNAHVALDADAPIMDKVDAYLNNGFYIE